MEKIFSKKNLTNFALMAGIFQPLMTIPQIIEIYSSKSATNVSLFTWSAFLFFGLILLIYGIKFRLKPIWVNQIIWAIMQSLTVIGIVIYG